MLTKSEIVTHYNNDLYKNHRMVDKLDEFRKKLERAELYESCARVRDMIQVLSDYILGYRKFDEYVLFCQMYAVKYFGELIDEGDGWSLWNVDSLYFYFDATEKEIFKITE